MKKVTLLLLGACAILLIASAVLSTLASLANAQSSFQHRVYLPTIGKQILPSSPRAIAQPRIDVEPQEVDFGLVEVGRTGTATVTISNIGEAPLVVSALSFGEFSDPSFQVHPNFTLPVTVAIGARATLDVTFSPETEGGHRTTLSIFSDDPQRPSVPVRLSGIGSTGQKIDDPQARQNYYHDVRAAPNITIPTGAHLLAWEQLQTLRREIPPPGLSLEVAPEISQIFRWKPVGPRNVGTTGAGRVTTIAVDSASVVYAGAALGGVFKSSDGGATWQSLMFHQPSLAIGSIAIDPTNRLTVYVGTGEPNFSDSYYGAGVLKATDGGALGDASWSNYGRAQFVFAAGGGATFDKIFVNPANTQQVFAATNLGFFRSTNGGVDWTQITSGIPSGWVSDLVMDPGTTPVTLYAAVPGNGVFRSTDAGQNWAPRSTGLPASGSIGRVALAIAPSNTQIIYAGIQNSADSSLLGVYRTDNGGGQWGQVNSMPAYCNFCWYANVLSVHPTNPNLLLAGGLNLNRGNVTLSAGTYTWSNNPGTIPGLHADQHAITWDPNNSNVVYVGNDGGLYRSTDGGNNFTRLDIGSITQHQGVAIHPTLPNFASSGSQDNGSMLYTGDVVNWTAVGPNCDGGWTAISQSLAPPNEVYITTQSNACARILRADSISGAFNGKTSGITIGGGGQPDGSALFYAPLVIDPSNPATLYYGSSFVYRTTNRADNWSYFPTPAQNLNGRVSTIAPAPSASTTIYAGTDTGRIWRTTTTPANWVEVGDFSAPCTPGTTCLPNRVVSRLAVHPTTPSTLYATFSGFNSQGLGRPGHVFRSTDSGATWTDITPRDRFNNRINLPVNVIVIDPNAPTRLFIGTDIGVLYSADNGTSWQFLNTGMPDVAILDMAINPGTGVVRAASHGRGMFDLLVQGPQVQVSKRLVTPASGTASQGDTVIYSIRITNTGTTAITSLPLDDIFDSRYLRFGSSSPPPTTVAPNLVEWDDLTGLPPGGTGRSLRVNETLIVTATFQVIGCPTSANTVNKARVSGAIDEDQNPVPTASASTALNIACASATLTKTRTSPPRVAQGELVTFDITIQNTGNVPITTLPLTDTYDPTALTFVSGSPVPDSTVPAGTLTWTDLTSPPPNGFGMPLAPGATFTVRLTFSADGCPPAQTTTDTARVTGAIATGPAGPINLPSMTASASVDIACPDIRVQKTLVPPPAGAITLGQIATFNITITNQGNKTIRRLPLEDLFDPTHLAFDSATPAPNAVGYGHVQWTDLTVAGPNGFGSDLPPGASVTVVLRLKAVGCPPNQDTTDKAKVANAIDEENNPVPTVESTATVKIACPAVAVTKQVIEPPCGIFGIGQPVPFVITVTNTGNSVLDVIPLVDTYDANILAFASATPTPDTTSVLAGVGTLTWNDLTGPAPHGFGANLPPGGHFTVNVTFTALASTSFQYPPYTVDRATVTGATDQYGFVAATATGTANATIKDADLFVQKTGPATAVAGSIVTWTVAYGNLGPDDAIHVRIRDIIPPGTTYLGDTLCGTVNTTGCFIPLLGAGVNGSFQVWVSVPMPTPPGTTLTNEAQIASGFVPDGPICGIPDRNPANNTSQSTVTIIADFGDAPDPPYPTRLANNGAFHRDYTQEWLGATADGEVDARFPDPDDDGVVFNALGDPPTYHFPGRMKFFVTINTSGLKAARYSAEPGRKLYLRVWLDWNNNGTWEPGEQLVEWSGGPGLPGTDGSLWPIEQTSRTIRFEPSVQSAPGLTWMRFRLSYGAPPPVDGPVDYGEVEDYPVRITSP